MPGLRAASSRQAALQDAPAVKWRDEPVCHAIAKRRQASPLMMRQSPLPMVCRTIRCEVPGSNFAPAKRAAMHTIRNPGDEIDGPVAQTSKSALQMFTRAAPGPQRARSAAILGRLPCSTIICGDCWPEAPGWRPARAKRAGMPALRGARLHRRVCSGIPAFEVAIGQVWTQFRQTVFTTEIGYASQLNCRFSR